MIRHGVPFRRHRINLLGRPAPDTFLPPMIKDSASAEPDPQDTLKTHRFGRDFGEGEEGGDGNKEGHTAKKGYNARNIEKEKRKKKESVDEGT